MPFCSDAVSWSGLFCFVCCLRMVAVLLSAYVGEDYVFFTVAASSVLFVFQFVLIWLHDLFFFNMN